MFFSIFSGPNNFPTFFRNESIAYKEFQKPQHGLQATLDPEGGIMTSKKKHKIARQNGAKAAGAKSPQGIQTSSMNALRHGLLSKVLVLSNESQTKFDELLQMYIEKFQPQDGVETNLVYEMVAAKWRQQRVWMVETAALELEMDDQQIDIDEHEAKGEKLNMTNPEQIAMAYTKMANNEKTLELFMRYENSFSRMHDRAMKALFRLREELNLRNDAKPSEAVSTPAVIVPKVNRPESPKSQPLSPEPPAGPVETNLPSIPVPEARPESPSPIPDNS